MKRLCKDGRWLDVSGIGDSNRARGLKRRKSEEYKNKQLSLIRKMLNELHELGHIE